MTASFTPLASGANCRDRQAIIDAHLDITPPAAAMFDESRIESLQEPTRSILAFALWWLKNSRPPGEFDPCGHAALYLIGHLALMLLDHDADAQAYRDSLQASTALAQHQTERIAELERQKAEGAQQVREWQEIANRGAR